MNDIEIFVRFRSSSIVPDLSSPLTVPDSSRQSCSRPRISEGKIGDSYSLEVATFAYVHTVLFNLFWVSPLFCFLVISHPDVTGF